ncbi:hypothetical protein B7494_g2683 [Chlorociboria aeruginascens]|nr:hypothetical protein B7494_g2683 [Chlorociboria aeruginascens]
MEKDGLFADFDDEGVYKQSQERVLLESTKNFVVEFGKDEAQIAFDLDAEDVDALLQDTAHQHQRPVRWINVWAPNRQLELVESIGIHYKFSPRLRAIIRTIPPAAETKHEKHTSRFKNKLFHKDDIELGRASFDTPATTPRPRSPPRTAHMNTSHYSIANQMINYQSIDVGPRCANWMHELAKSKTDDSLAEEGKQRRLWSWLVLCDDNTVISLHEDASPVNHAGDLKSMRGNTLSVFSQLSRHGHHNADPISMQTVRQVLDLDAAQANPGIEGASNLFYYLFDDWRAVYATIATYHARLENLTRRSDTTPNIEIIPRLHILGRQIRQMEHLYEGYKNLIQRVLEPKGSVAQAHGTSTPGSFIGLNGLTNSNGSRGIVLAQSASKRFERLGDRLQLMILSETREFLAEKDALISTYFNINAQKDSEATARLTRSATLLAKLSVLFLPVSLMTSYFSTQISDLQGIYTAKDYCTHFGWEIARGGQYYLVLDSYLVERTKYIEKNWLRYWNTTFDK